MNSLEISLRDPRPAYLPGDHLHCRLRWDLENEPEDLRIHLLWYTEGKGNRDSGIAAEEILRAPGTRGERDISLRLPAAPFSFSGKLISLRWAVEALSRKPKADHHLPIVLSPSGVEIPLGEPEESVDAKVPKGCFSLAPNRRT